MDSSSQTGEPPSSQDTETAVEEYERLIAEYFDLAQEYAKLEATEMDNRSWENGEDTEIIAEMGELKTKLAALCETFDEDDYRVLFDGGGE